MREMKDSGIEWIGAIPKTWKVEKLCREVPIITDFVASGSFATINDNVEYLDYPDYAMLVRTADLSGTKDKRVYINKHAYEFLSNSNLFGGEVILSNIGSVGNVYMYEPLYERSSLAPNAIMLNGSKNNRYIYYWFLSPHSNEELKRIGGNAVQLKFNKTQLKQFKIAIPPTEEQHRISAYLDNKCTKIDTIIEKQQTIIEKLKAYKLSLITEAVTKGLNPDVKMKDSGSIWFSSIPINWKLEKIKYIFSIKKDIANQDGLTVLSITQKGICPKNMRNNGGQWAESYANYQKVNKGDFAMNHMDLLTGWVDISDYNGVTSPDYRVFVLNDKQNYFPKYYLYFMQMCYMDKIFYGLGQGVSSMGRWRLQADKFLNFHIPIPPYSEQTLIAEYLDKKCSAIDCAIAKKQTLIEKLTEYKKSLIYEVVTGKKEV